MKIITDADLLRLPCSYVKPNERLEFKSLIAEMKEFVLENNGLGLAAPQVGIQKAFFVILTLTGKVDVIFNPEIQRRSEEIVESEEMCFSCPGIVKTVLRAKEIKVRYRDSLWREKRVILTGLSSKIFQHESDHLVGKLIADIV